MDPLTGRFSGIHLVPQSTTIGNSHPSHAFRLLVIGGPFYARTASTSYTSPMKLAVRMPPIPLLMFIGPYRIRLLIKPVGSFHIRQATSTLVRLVTNSFNRAVKASYVNSTSGSESAICSRLVAPMTTAYSSQLLLPRLWAPHVWQRCDTSRTALPRSSYTHPPSI